jgi:acetylornithine deacetylase/succinyl-diaminopimelate desuccinylase-like protein
MVRLLAGGLLEALQGVESFLQTSHSLPLNVKFLLEGQEEVGSPNLEAFLRRHKGGLLANVDLAISADGGQIAADQPGEAVNVLCYRQLLDPGPIVDKQI